MNRQAGGIVLSVVGVVALIAGLRGTYKAVWSALFGDTGRITPGGASPKPADTWKPGEAGGADTHNRGTAPAPGAPGGDFLDGFLVKM